MMDQLAAFSVIASRYLGSSLTCQLIIIMSMIQSRRNTAMHRAAEPDEAPNQWANPVDAVEVFIYLASNAAQQVNGQRFQAQEENWGQQTDLSLATAN